MFSPRGGITDDEHELEVACGEAADEADAEDDARDVPASVDAGEEAESAIAVPIVAADPFDTDAELRFPFGRIVYYAGRREIVAECRHAGHGQRCRRTRTNNGDPAVLAQGRPLATPWPPFDRPIPPLGTHWLPPGALWPPRPTLGCPRRHIATLWQPKQNPKGNIRQLMGFPSQTHP